MCEAGRKDKARHILYYSLLFVIIRYYSLLFFSVKNINRLVAARLEARWRVDTAGWIVYIE